MEKPANRRARAGTWLGLALAWWAPWVLGAGTYGGAPNIGFTLGIDVFYKNIKAIIPTAVFFLVVAGIWAFATEHGRSTMQQHGKTIIAVGMMATAVAIPAVVGAPGALV